jgi:hypothetical protein
MRISNTVKYALGVTAAAAILAGCSGGSQVAPSAGGGSATSMARQAQAHGVYSLIPASMQIKTPGSVLGKIAPLGKGGAKAGLYASEFYGSEVFGYKASGKGSPTCTIDGVSYINGIAADGKGNVIDPDGGSRSVIVFAPNCGSVIGTIADNDGQPADASSANAATGTIAVGNIFGPSGSGDPGSITLCTIKKGCTTNLTNANMYEVAGVAMDNKGNCWASAINSGGTATLTYFAKCKGAGAATTGFLNGSFGGLDIDSKGNLVSLDLNATAMYVYSGCNPKCTKVAGPLALHGEAVFGHLNKTGKAFAAANISTGAVDLYKYSGTALTYTSSVTSGLSVSLQPEGAAYAPRSKQ